VDALKIAGAFLRHIETDPVEYAMVEAIHRVGHVMNLKTVAEGVETMEQYAFLRSLGCRQAQGFLWSPAVPIDKLQLALATCDQVCVTAPELPTPLQRQRVDDHLTALMSKRQGEQGTSLAMATALDGVMSPGGSGTGEERTWATEVSGAPLGLEMIRSAPLVLVCEDVAPIRRLVRTDLELAGFAVEEAPDGHAAMGLLIQPDTRRPDVIVIDCQELPYDSWWAIAAIRAHPALDHIPALLVTADAGDHHTVEAEEAGFDGIVPRPFLPDDLARTVALLAATGRQPHRRPRAGVVHGGDRRSARQASGPRQ
jgi:CheY-like chemotaxis protein